MQLDDFMPFTPEDLNLPELPTPWGWRISVNEIFVTCGGVDIYSEVVDLGPDIDLNIHKGCAEDMANYRARWEQAGNAALRFATSGRVGTL